MNKKIFEHERRKGLHLRIDVVCERRVLCGHKYSALRASDVAFHVPRLLGKQSHLSATCPFSYCHIGFRRRQPRVDRLQNMSPGRVRRRARVGSMVLASVGLPADEHQRTSSNQREISLRLPTYCVVGHVHTLYRLVVRVSYARPGGT